MKRKTDSTINRIYDPSLLLETDIVKAVLERFRYDVPAIFGDSLAFGCIVGGFAKGYAVSDQDIDMFICVNEVIEQKVNTYRDFYFSVHNEFNLVADHEKPGELMTLGRLCQKISLVNYRSLRPVIESYYEYEGLLWAEMLTGPKTAIIGDYAKLNKITESCETLPQKWRHEIYKLMGDTLDIETAKLPIHRLIKAARKKGFITYKKEGKGESNDLQDAYR